MLFTDVIRTKRDGGALSDEQIRYFVDGLADGQHVVAVHHDAGHAVGLSLDGEAIRRRLLP